MIHLAQSRALDVPKGGLRPATKKRLSIEMIECLECAQLRSFHRIFIRIIGPPLSLKRWPVANLRDTSCFFKQQVS